MPTRVFSSHGTSVVVKEADGNVAQFPCVRPFLTILITPPLKIKNQSPLHKILFNQKKHFVSGETKLRLLYFLVSGREH